MGGLSWENVPDVEKDVLQRLLPFLEDRRVLYSPSDVEVLQHCVDSILQIREFVVTQAGLLAADSELGATLRSMAGACRAFLDRAPGPHGRGRLWHPAMGWDIDSWIFNQSLGELRAQFGFYLQDLAQRYKLDLPGPLVSILPPAPEPG